MMDDQSWAISELVIKIGHRFSGQEVQVAVAEVERISYEDSTVFVKLTKAAVEKGSEHKLAQFRVAGFTSPERTTGQHQGKKLSIA
jgi:hypothetical protein